MGQSRHNILGASELYNLGAMEQFELLCAEDIFDLLLRLSAELGGAASEFAQFSDCLRFCEVAAGEFAAVVAIAPLLLVALADAIHLLISEVPPLFAVPAEAVAVKFGPSASLPFFRPFDRVLAVAVVFAALVFRGLLLLRLQLPKFPLRLPFHLLEFHCALRPFFFLSA